MAEITSTRYSLADGRKVRRPGSLATGTEPLPRPRFDHLRRLTGNHGLWEHAHLTTPRIEHGYCTDDNARALIVACREPQPTEPLVQLAELYLNFLDNAQLAHGGFHNRRSSNGAWMDDVGSDDSQGRALWALGFAARLGPTPRLRTRALHIFEKNATFQSDFPRSNAFALLGAAEILEAIPRNNPARALLERCAFLPSGPADDEWPWPEPRLTYDNARIPEAMIAFGAANEDDVLLNSGLALLEWLVETETQEDRFSFAPVGGWGPGEPRPGFDQQPVEGAAMADACSRAWAITRDGRWKERTGRAARWYLGDNDTGLVLYDKRTGGCCDGLTRHGLNHNQGAESTLAALSSLQQAHRAAGNQRGALVSTPPVT